MKLDVDERDIAGVTVDQGLRAAHKAGFRCDPCEVQRAGEVPYIVQAKGRLEPSLEGERHEGLADELTPAGKALGDGNDFGAP